MIVKNCSREEPGLLETLLKNHSLPYKIVDLERGGHFPSPIDYSALIVLGGPDSANDPGAKIKNALDRIQEALAFKIPFFGICLGLQLLVKAGGGAVLKNPVKEIGFRDPENQLFEVRLTPQGEKDPLFIGIGSPFKIFQLHGETVQLADGMTLLGTGKHCRNQIVKAGALAYGIQGHVEITEDLLKVWLQKDPDLKHLRASALQKEHQVLLKEIFYTGSKIFTNFFKQAGIFKKEGKMK
ncbi:MAG: type 1 glutamine amidotransferase [Nitrospiria bacterium]